MPRTAATARSGPLQDRLDDPVPLFELVLSPRAAKRAVPVLGAVAAAGIGLLARGVYAAAAAPVIAATTSSRGVVRRSKVAATRPRRSTTMRSATE